jgi:hypothetical protein
MEHYPAYSNTSEDLILEHNPCPTTRVRAKAELAQSPTPSHSPGAHIQPCHIRHNIAMAEPGFFRCLSFIFILYT